jgi:DNA-binding FrmR family transcriptional regulator
MQLPEDVVDDVRRRLRRAGGQVNGVERMLADGRECRDVLIQLSAATRAVQQAGYRLIVSGLTYCLEHPQDAMADGYPLESLEKLFKNFG